MQEIGPLSSFFLSVEIGVKRRSRLIFPTQVTRSLVICFNINMVAWGHFRGRLSRPGACVPYGRLSTQATGRLWFVSVACYINLHGHL